MSARSVRFQRIRAVCIGALVLGIGASVTLAAWTDSENAEAQFSAGIFGIEARNAISGSFVDASPSGLPVQTFTLPANASALIPGTTVYSGFQVRTVQNSVGGVLQMSGMGAATGSTALLNTLRYAVRLIPGTAACDEVAFAGSTAFVVGSASTGVQPLTAAGATAQVLAPSQTETLHYCFQFSLPSDAPGTLQGAVASARWTFTGSTSS